MVRDSSRDTDDPIISFSDTDGPIVLWAENEISRDPGVAENISEVFGEVSDVLQASLVDDKCSDVSGIRGACCRICTEGGRCPRKSWAHGEVSKIPWVEDGISTVLWEDGDVSNGHCEYSDSPRSSRLDNNNDNDCPECPSYKQCLKLLQMTGKYLETHEQMVDIQELLVLKWIVLEPLV